VCTGAPSSRAAVTGSAPAFFWKSLNTTMPASSGPLWRRARSCREVPKGETGASALICSARLLEMFKERSRSEPDVT